MSSGSGKMKSDKLRESGLSQRRFGTTLFLFKLAGIPLDTNSISKVQSVYNATIVLSYYITFSSCFLELYFKRNDLEQFMKNIRMCLSMTFLSVFDIFFRYEYMLLKTILLNNIAIQRMASSGMLRRVALVRTDVSEELRASFIRVTKSGELGTTLAVTSNRRTLRKYFFAACVGC
jgi:hypothetical protein